MSPLASISLDWGVIISSPANAMSPMTKPRSSQVKDAGLSKSVRALCAQPSCLSVFVPVVIPQTGLLTTEIYFLEIKINKFIFRKMLFLDFLESPNSSC